MAATAIKINIGEKFGRLTVIENAGKSNRRENQWLCSCICGQKTITVSSKLKSGHTRSCGCLYIEKARRINFKHGLRKHPLYNVWAEMKQRCYNKNNSNYQYYGKRSIKICEKWMDNPATFIEWGLSNGYRTGLHIDRINNNGNYEPFNCRFVTHKENMRNRKGWKKNGKNSY